MKVALLPEMSPTTDASRKMVAPFAQFSLATNVELANLWSSLDPGFVSPVLTPTARYFLQSTHPAKPRLRSIDSGLFGPRGRLRSIDFAAGPVQDREPQTATQLAVDSQLVFSHSQRSRCLHLRNLSYSVSRLIASRS